MSRESNSSPHGDAYIPSIRTCSNKGVQIAFPSGWIISIQWGPFNYCEHNNKTLDLDQPKMGEFWSSKDAEIALWHRDRVDWYYFGSDDVKGYVGMEELATWIHQAATDTLPPEPPRPTYDDPEY